MTNWTFSRHSRGFTLIELMIVIAIVAILVALAVPAYRDYTIRSKVTECIGASAVPKIQISEFQMTTANWPANPNEAGIDQSFSTFTSGGFSHYCRIYFYNSGQGDFAVMVNTGAVDDSLAGQQIIPVFSPTLNTSRNIDWTCTRGFTSTEALKYLPSSCRGANIY